jgi:hypothetical protein
MTLKSFLLNLAIAILGALIVFGGAWLAGAFENDIVVEEDEILLVEGPQGPRGYAGPVGPQGPAGPAGAVGPKGADAVIDIEDLADAVVDELEDREDRIDVRFTGGAGDTVKTFEVLDDDSFEFTFRKYTAGDFEVSLEHEDGDIIELLDTTGHVNTEDTRFLDEGEWTLYISSEGSWRIDVEQL